MKARRVTLLDLGLDASFDASMQFIQSTMSNINAGYEDDLWLEVDFVRSRDPETIHSAITAPCDVLHVMAHGDSTVEPAFTSSDGKTTLTLSSLAEGLLQQGWGIQASVVIADGCSTATGRWQKAIRDCLYGGITYVGTSKMIGWHESSTFCSGFYNALTRNKGKGRTPQEQGLDAATRASEAYQGLTDRPSPFKVVELEPSRRARAALKG